MKKFLSLLMALLLACSLFTVSQGCAGRQKAAGPTNQ